jgi:hypothetical protein
VNGWIDYTVKPRNLQPRNLQPRNLRTSSLLYTAWSHLLHTITLAICGFRNLRYNLAWSQNQQIAGFYCTYAGVPNCHVHTPILSGTIFPTTCPLIGTTCLLIFKKKSSQQHEDVED